MSKSFGIKVVEIVEGDAENCSGFIVIRNGIKETYLSEEAELVLSEAGEISTSLGRPYISVANSLIEDFLGRIYSGNTSR